MKHSPLPWELSRGGAVTCDDGLVVVSPDNAREGADNALIVRSVNALPLCIDAMEAALALIEQGPDRDDHSAARNHFIPLCRAALAAAKGDA